MMVGRRSQALRQLPRAVLLLSLAMLGACRSAVGTAPAPSNAAGPVASPARTATRIPRDAARFAIDVVDDSTARFKPREALWVRPGMIAYVVDPTNRDALIARMRIESVWHETAVALVLSQVTRVTTDHVVLMVPPTRPWWKSRRFWMGTVAGGLLGGAIGAVAAH